MKLELSEEAEFDLSEIWVYNAEHYSIVHADKYQAFLLEQMEYLVEYPRMGRTFDELPHLRYLVIKWRSGGHGHAAYYEIRDDIIWVVRILHTAMNAPDHLENGR